MQFSVLRSVFTSACRTAPGTVPGAVATGFSAGATAIRSGILLLIFPTINFDFRVANAQTPTVPAPPSARADRFGLYNWGTDFSAYPGDDNGQRDRLNWVADQVAATGSRTIRVFLGPRDMYFVNPPLNSSQSFDLVQAASSAAYDKLFRDARFKTYLLTAYTDKGFLSDWFDGYTNQEYQAEREKYQHLGQYLLGNANYAGKTFIVLNWEGDNAMSGANNKQSAWDAYVRWTQARADGISDARRANAAEAGRLFSALEFNSIEFPDGKPCGTAVADPIRENPLKYRCVIDYVAPRVAVDYYSYSSWHTIARKQLNLSISFKKLLKDDLTFALGKVRATRPAVEEKNFLIGEAGFARVRFGECLAAVNTSELFEALEAADAFKASWAIYWQVIDNSPVWDNDVLGLHGLYRLRNGQLEPTLAGKVWQAKIAGQEFAVPGDCPRIRETPAGIVNPQNGTHEFSLYPDSSLQINASGTASPFSGTGNKITFIQNYAFHQVSRDNAAGLTESPLQLTVNLPPARNPGWASAYVTDQRGIDSNGQILYFGCADCPAIRDRFPVLNAARLTDEHYPGSVSAVFGHQFSPTGNQVIVEQLDKFQQVRVWNIPKTNGWTEASNRITLRLPDELLTDRLAYLYVTDIQGRKSNRTFFYVSAVPCSNCSPGLLPVDSVLNRVTQKMDFHPGTQVMLRGINFSSSGNQVIVEQGGRKFTLARETAWTESPTQITAALPASLQPGVATIYVVDVNGRESAAAEISLTSTAVTSVSAASYNPASIAAEAITAAFGTALATTTSVSSHIPLPTELSGTRVLVKDSAGIERSAPLFFVSPSQVNYQIPPQTASGNATVTIVSGDGSISVGTLQIENVAPGVFTANSSGNGLAAALALRVRANGEQLYEPIAQYDAAQQKFVAMPIDLAHQNETVYLVLFGTGWRFHSAPAAVTVSIDGSQVPVEFAGAQGTQVGLDQINVRLPRTLSGKGQVNVVVNVDGKTANQAAVTFR